METGASFNTLSTELVPVSYVSPKPAVIFQNKSFYLFPYGSSLLRSIKNEIVEKLSLLRLRVYFTFIYKLVQTHALRKPLTKPLPASLDFSSYSYCVICS